MDDLIRNRNAKLAAFQQEIDTLKETLSNKVKEKESLSKMLTVFKTESKEKESKYIGKEIVLEIQNKELKNIICDLDNSTNNVLIPLDSWTSGLLVYRLPLSVRMTKVIKGEFNKIMDIKVKDDSLACDSPLEVFNCEVSRLSKMDDDLFTYEVEIANIPCDLRVDDDSEHEADDMGFDPSDIAFTEWLGSKFFNYKTMDHYTIKALWIYWIRGDDEIRTYLQRILWGLKPMMITKTTGSTNGIRMYHGLMRNHGLTLDWINDGYCNGGNLPGTFIIENQLHYQDYEWYEALEDSELKDEALRNKAIMEGFIKDDDDESSYEQMRRWDIYTNYDDTYKTNHDDNEREELCEVHEPPVCTIQRFEMIKYSFGQGEEYVAIKEDEYDDLARTSNNACRTYQEIFRMMDEGCMVTRAD
ncbi:hypothetical protein Tco_1204893 [Tanacetum coccineum]